MFKMIKFLFSAAFLVVICTAAHAEDFPFAYSLDASDQGDMHEHFGRPGSFKERFFVGFEQALPVWIEDALRADKGGRGDFKIRRPGRMVHPVIHVFRRHFGLEFPVPAFLGENLRLCRHAA